MDFKVGDKVRIKKRVDGPSNIDMKNITGKIKAVHSSGKYKADIELEDGEIWKLKVTENGSFHMEKEVVLVEKADLHHGHDVVRNSVNGETFYVCKQCKIEVVMQ